MAKVAPKHFILGSQEGPVEVLDVQLHEDIRSDRDGRAFAHFSVSGAVKAALDDFETITVGLKFSLYDGDACLGVASARDLRLDPGRETISFGPLEGPVAASDARISRVTLDIEARVVTMSTRSVDLVLSET